MNWSWEPSEWKKSTKVLLGLATIWPVIYIGLFLITIFSIVFLLGFEDGAPRKNSESIDLIQLHRKIIDGDLKQLTVKSDEIVAIDRVGGRQYHTYASNESTRAEILREAREVNANGQPRVAKVEEETGQPVASPLFPIGFVVLFCAHMFTILLSIALMPLYIILAVKTDRLDQTMRIIWVVLICMMGMFVMPVYWYLYIWRDAPPNATMASANNIDDKLSL